MKQFFMLFIINIIFHIYIIPDIKAEQLCYSPIWLKNQSAFTQLEQNEQFYFIKRYEIKQNNMFVIGFAIYSFSPTENALKVWAYDQEQLDFINIDTIYYGADRLQEINAAVLSRHKPIPVELSHSQLFYIYIWSHSFNCYSNAYGNMFILPKNVYLHKENRLYFYKTELDTMRLSIIHNKTSQFTYCPNVCRAVFFDQQGYGYIQSTEQNDQCEKNPFKPVVFTDQSKKTKLEPAYTDKSKSAKYSVWNFNKHFLNQLYDDEKLYFVKCSEECNESSFILGYVIYSYSAMSNQWRIWQYNKNTQQFEIYETIQDTAGVNKCHREINSVVLMKQYSRKRVSKLISNEKLFKINIWTLTKEIYCEIFKDTFLLPLPQSILAKEKGSVSRLYFKKNELSNIQLANVQHHQYYTKMKNICKIVTSDENGYACFQYKYDNENCVSLKRKEMTAVQRKPQIKGQKYRWYERIPRVDHFDNKEYLFFNNYGYVHLNASFYKNIHFIEPLQNYFITNISNQDIVYSPINCGEQLCSFYKRNRQNDFISCLWVINNNKIYPVGILKQDWYTKTMYLDANHLKRSLDADLQNTFQSLSVFFKQYQNLSLQQREYFRKLVCENNASCFSDFRAFDNKQYTQIAKRLNSIHLRIKPNTIQLDNKWLLKKKMDQIWIAQKKGTTIFHTIKPPSKKEFRRVRLAKDEKGQIIGYYYVIDVHDEFEDQIDSQAPDKFPKKFEYIPTQPYHHQSTTSKTIKKHIDKQADYHTPEKVQIKPKHIQTQRHSRKSTITNQSPLSQTKVAVEETEEASEKIWVIFDDYVDNSGYLSVNFKQFKQSKYIKNMFDSCKVYRFDLIQGLTIKRRPSDFKIWNNSQFHKVAEIQSLLELSPHSLEERDTKWELHLFLARNTRGVGYDGIENKLINKLKKLNVKTIIVWEFCDYKPAEITMYKKLFSDISLPNRFKFRHFIVSNDYRNIKIPFINKNKNKK